MHEKIKEILELSGLEHKASAYLTDFLVDLNDSHVEILPSILWSFATLNWNIPE